jgi:hypothetical protein
VRHIRTFPPGPGRSTSWYGTGLAELAWDNAPDSTAPPPYAPPSPAPCSEPPTTATSYRRLGRDDLAHAAYREHERDMRALGTHPDPEITRLAAQTTQANDNETARLTDPSG